MKQNHTFSSKTGTVLIVSGPSGSGKSTLCKMLTERNPNLRFSVSCTTRKPRPGELNGKDYWFVSEKEFKKKLKNDEFLEYAEVHGCHYGTLRRELEDCVEKGRDALLDIDVAGARQVRRRILETPLRAAAVWIFIAPPSPELMEQRLRRRATEEEEAVVRRLDHAERETPRSLSVDYGDIHRGDLSEH